MTIPLHLGPIEVPGYAVVRSGLRWLRRSGYVCNPGEAVAYCNVTLLPSDAASSDPLPDERRDLQVVLAPRIGGVLRPALGTSLGGSLDQQANFVWNGDEAIGMIAPTAPVTESEPTELRLMVVAGRRMTELAEMRSGPLSGWHERSRAWWGDGSEAPDTMLSIGTCDQASIIRGDSGSFVELFRDVAGPAQVVVSQDEPLVPCARVLLEQLTRSSAERERIAEDMARSILAGRVTPGAADWLFMGALLSGLSRSPLTESPATFSRRALVPGRPPGVVILSLMAEMAAVLRHRRLGYTLCIYPFRLAEVSPSVSAWLREHFEPVRRGPEAILQDYKQLLDAIRDRTDAVVLAVNLVATRASESIHVYAGLDAPLSASLSSVHIRELNLMLHDVSRDHRLEIVDLESIVAGIGIAQHLPDYIHPSGRLQAEMRAEILRILRTRGVRGFAARSGSGISRS